MQIWNDPNSDARKTDYRLPIPPFPFAAMQSNAEPKDKTTQEFP